MKKEHLTLSETDREQYYEPDTARRELRRVLWVLNKSLGSGWLEVEHQLVSLLPQPDLWVDVDRFRELLTGCNQHHHAAGEICLACVESSAKL